MEQTIWIGRQRSAIAMARKAVTSEASPIQFELSGRYSIEAAQHVPFTPPGGLREMPGERALLHLHDAPLPGPRQILQQRGPGVRQDPEGNVDRRRLFARDVS